MNDTEKTQTIIRDFIILFCIWFIFGFTVPLFTGLGYLKTWFMMSSTFFNVFCALIFFIKHARLK